LPSCWQVGALPIGNHICVPKRFGAKEQWAAPADFIRASFLQELLALRKSADILKEAVGSLK